MSLKLSELRTLVCSNVRTVCKLCHDNAAALRDMVNGIGPTSVLTTLQWDGKYARLLSRQDALRAEARTWNDVAVILKRGCGGQIPPLRHVRAVRRLRALHEWIKNNGGAAQRLCTPLWLRYESTERRCFQESSCNTSERE